MNANLLKLKIFQLAKQYNFKIVKIHNEWEIRENGNIVLYVVPRLVFGNQIDRLKLYHTEYTSENAKAFMQNIKDLKD